MCRPIIEWFCYIPSAIFVSSSFVKSFYAILRWMIDAFCAKQSDHASAELISYV